MKNTRDGLLDLTLGAYILLPMFFRIGPVSVYLIGILAMCLYVFLTDRFHIPGYVRYNGGWLIRLLLVFIPMVVHREITAMMVYFAAPCCLMLLLVNRLRTPRQINRILDLVIWCSVINGAVCLFELLTQINLSYLLCTDGTAVYAPLFRYGILRVAGAFVNAINNGLFCMFVTVLALYRIFSGNLQPRKRFCFWLIWAMNVIVIVLTSSRAALLVAAVANLLVLWLAGALRFTPMCKKMLAGAAVAFVLMLIIPNPVGEWVKGILLSMLQLLDDLLGLDLISNQVGDTRIEGVGQRLELFKWVVDDVGENFLFGKGKAAKFEYVVNEWGHTKQSIENQYLFEFFRYGIVGLVGKVVLFASILYRSYLGLRNERKMGTRLGLNSVLFVVFLMYFVSLFTVAQNEERKLFYILVALSEIYAHNRIYQRSQTKSRAQAEKTRKKQEINIVLFGTTLQSDNKGCEALAYTLFYILNTVLRRHDMTANISSVVYQPYGQTLERDLSAFDRIRHTFLPNRKKSLKAQLAIANAVRGCDLCIDLTDGDSFSDIYGKSRFYWRTAEKAFVLLCGKKMLLGPQTYGPYQSKGAKRCAAWVLKRAKYVYSRDEKSAALVKELTGRQIAVFTDIAFKLPKQIREHLNGQQTKIGINVSGLLWNGGYTGDNQFGLTVDYRDYITRLIRWCLEKKMQVYLIPHVITAQDENNVENDLKVCRQLQAQFPECRIIGHFDTPMEIKGYISQMDIFTGARMHSTIAAFSSGVATIPFAYSKKFGDLFGTVKYPYLIDGRTMTTDEAFERSCIYISNAKKLTEAVRRSSADVMARANAFCRAMNAILPEEVSHE